MFRKLRLGRNIGWGVGVQYHLTFDLAVVTLNVKISSRLYVGNCKVLEVLASHQGLYQLILFGLSFVVFD